MKTAIFAGTFDPPTFGHLEMIDRASKLFSTLYVAIGENSQKTQCMLTLQERLDVLTQLTAPLRNVKVVAFTGLVVDYAKQQKIDILVRGLRGPDDIAYESAMAAANRKMSGIETLFLMASGEQAHLSSSLIREIGASGQHLELFVPNEVATLLYR